MHTGMTGEQQQASDALRRWVERGYPFEHRQQVIASAQGVRREDWRALADLGLPALGVPEGNGGLGGSALDQMIAMQEMGRALLVEPLFATLWGCSFLRLGDGHSGLLERVATGDAKLACAVQEAHAHHDLHEVRCRVRQSDQGYELSGCKSFVVHGAQADALIVSARSAGGDGDHDGIALFVVPGDTPGLQRIDCASFDGLRTARIVLDTAQLPLSARLGPVGACWPVLDAAWDFGTALLCAEALGVLEMLCETTLEHLRSRQQFGSPIGRFQALQHRMADVYLQVEQSRSMALLAATHVDHADPGVRQRCVSAAKARIGEALRFVSQQAVQLHGALGVSDEMRVSHLFKRAAAIELSLGDSDYHIARFAACSSFAPD